MGTAENGWIKVRLAAVGFLNGHLKIATTGRRVEVADGKMRRGNIALVDDVAVLLNGHLRVRLGDTADHRGEPAQAVRQHIIVRSKLRTAELDAVENIRRCVAVAERQLSLQALDIPVEGTCLLNPSGYRYLRHNSGSSSYATATRRG